MVRVRFAVGTCSRGEDVRMRARTVVKRSSPPHDTSAYFFCSILAFEDAILGGYFSSVRRVLYISGLLVWPQAVYGWVAHWEEIALGIRICRLELGAETMILLLD